jgi:DNA mismatch repair protein MutL
MTIKILNEDIIKLIRAGEVIERPSSIVKELVENSIDAKATRIDIKIDKGGKSFISINDDGLGISENDLPLVFHPHATSKLTDINDIKTLGFRGEALASVKHVSQVNIISRVNGFDAWTLDKDNEIFPSSGQNGTFIAVKDLFKDFPARYAFLKNDRIESKYIKNTVNEIALGHPEITFFLTEGNVTHIALNKKDITGRINDIFGNEFLNNSINIKISNDSYELNMFLGIPTFTKHSKIGQHLYVNGRNVKNNSFKNMLKTIFQNLSKEQPSCIAWLTIPEKNVNCNIHPSKKEVLIKNEDDIMKDIIEKSKEKLSQFGPSTSETLSELAVKLAKPIDPNKNEEYMPLGKPIGMFQKNYILSESQSGLILIDLHAAHERVVLQKLLKEHEEKGIKGRKLDSPMLYELSKQDIEILDEYEDELQKIGFIYTYMDKGISVISIPNYVSEINILKWIENVILMLHNNPYLDVGQDFFENICSLIACHNSFRRKELSLDEMSIYLREIEQTPFTSQCNHGRPTSVVLSNNDIEKIFKR